MVRYPGFRPTREKVYNHTLGKQRMYLLRQLFRMTGYSRVTTVPWLQILSLRNERSGQIVSQSSCREEIMENICILRMSVVQIVHRPEKQKKNTRQLAYRKKKSTGTSSKSASSQHATAHDSEGAHGVMVRSSAGVPDVKFELELALGRLVAPVGVELLVPLPPLLVVLVLDKGVEVPDGMSDAGTAEIGPPAWAPVGGL